MKVINATKAYPEDPIRFFDFERYANQCPKDLTLIVGYIDFEKTDDWKQGNAVFIDLEMPNYLFVKEHAQQRFALDAIFNKVLTICPFTSTWRNNSLQIDKYQSTFFPFNPDYIARDFEKKYDVIYTGHIVHPEIQKIIDSIKQFNYRFVSHDQNPLVTNRNSNYTQKIDLIASSKIMVVNNLLFPSARHLHDLMSVPNWQSNTAFAEINAGMVSPVVPQLKSRVVEAAFSKTLILCKRDRWNLIENFFNPDEDFVYYDDDNLSDQISIILSNWDHYQQIAENAFQKATKRYSTQEYFNQYILPIAESLKRQLKPKPSSISDNHSTRSDQISQKTQQLFASDNIRLHLGCGEQYLEGYVNIDYPPSEHSVQSSSPADYYADITTLNFPDSSIDEIRLHHVFEHFDRPTAHALLCEWHRWLKPSGILIIETPDLEACIKQTLDPGLTYQQKQFVLRHMYGSHEANWAIHKDGWYKDKFLMTLSQLGFSEVQFHFPGNRIIRNILVVSRKMRDINRALQHQNAKNLMRDSMADQSPQEEKLWNIWCAEFDRAIERMGETQSPFQNKTQNKPIPFASGDQEQAMKQLVTVIFSKDRPFQLDATLKSLIDHCQDMDLSDITVIYKSSSEGYLKHYTELIRENPKIQFIQETQFKTNLLDVISRYAHVLFLVDDNIFVRNFHVSEILAYLKALPQAIGFSLRLGKNTIHSYAFNKDQPLPTFIELKKSILMYDWTTAKFDFGYPLEVSSSVYRTADILELVSKLPTHNPNLLEECLIQNKAIFFQSKPNLICYDESRTFCVPINKVQSVAKTNRTGSQVEYQVEELDKLFSDGYRLDTYHYNGFTPNACHQEVKLVYTKRSGSGQTELPKGRNCNSKDPLISVIIPCYNYAHLLREAVVSVVTQSYPRLEVIIVDDESPDNTTDVANKIKQDYPDKDIIYIRVPNGGVSKARNIGISLAKGELILPLDADDILKTDAIDHLWTAITSNPGVDIAYSDYECFGDKTGRINCIDEAGFSTPNRPIDGLPYCALYRKKVWEKVGGYNPIINGYEDWNFWIGCVDSGFKAIHVSEPLFLYRVKKSSLGLSAMRYDIEYKSLIIANHPKLFPNASVKNAHDNINRWLLPHSLAGDIPQPAPLVSIIVPTYNRPLLLEKALTSIENQSYKSLEIIVINDGGEAVDWVIAKFNEKLKIHYLVHDKNFGMAAARNTGLRAANGKYIGYLDDDDVFYNEHVETLVRYLEKNDQMVAYTDAYRAHQILENGEYVTKAKDIPYSYDFDPDQILVTNFIPTLCIMHSASILSMVGLFDETLRTHEDWDLWIRMSRVSTFQHIKRTTCEFSWRMDGSSTSSSRYRDFIATLEKLYTRYRSYLADKPGLKEYQSKVLSKKKHEIEVIDHLDRILESKNYNESLAVVPQDLLPELLKLAKSEHSKFVLYQVENSRVDQLRNFLEYLKTSPWIKNWSPDQSYEVDVVIPVFNNPEILNTCIKSLLRTEPSAHLVVVDDCSTDPAIQKMFDVMKHLPNVTTAKTPQNMGFIGATELGASLGKSPFILFLNSDTEAIDTGWISQMIPEDEKIAIVGAKLLYPPSFPAPLGGTIQHAGVTRDYPDHPYHIFAGFSEDAPEVNQAIEVNAVTGGCFLIRRSVWEEMDGWDKNFGRGVFEDVDLCWRARERGYKVIYQPKSRLYHYEHGSKSSDGNHSLFEFTNENRVRLFEKWKHLESDEEIFLGKRQAENLKKSRKYLKEAEKALTQGMVNEAVNLLRKSLKLSPIHFEAVVGLAQIYSSQGKHKQALELFQKALDLQPISWAVHLRIVDELAILDQPEAAAKALIPLLRLFPNDPKVLQAAIPLSGYLTMLHNQDVQVKANEQKEIFSTPKSKDPPESTSQHHETTNSAENVLETLLNAEDINRALADHAFELNNEVLELVQQNISAARADGETELAEGLEALAETIRDILKNRYNQKTKPMSSAEILEALLSAEDILQALVDWKKYLDQELLDLIQENIRAAQQDGESDLAEGLQYLFDAIKERVILQPVR